MTSKPVPVPSQKTLEFYSDSEPFDNHFQYRSIIGKLKYLAILTKPDIQFAVHLCARRGMDMWLSILQKVFEGYIWNGHQDREDGRWQMMLVHVELALLLGTYENWLQMPVHFHQSCYLIENIKFLWACLWNSELILVKTTVDYQTHDDSSKMNNQPDNFPEVWGIMLEEPSYSVELPAAPNILMMFLLIPLFWMEWVQSCYWNGCKFFYQLIFLILYGIFYKHSWS